MNFKESKLSKSLQFIDSHLNFSPLGRWHEEKTRRKLVQDSNPMSNPATVSTEQPPEKCPSPKGLIRLKETKFIDVHDVLERKKKDRQSLSNQKNASFLPSYFIPVATSSVKEVLHITVVDTLGIVVYWCLSRYLIINSISELILGYLSRSQYPVFGASQTEMICLLSCPKHWC